MITVLIRVKHGPEALVMTLSSLVPAVAAGLVGDAVILARHRDVTLAAVADGAGATLVVSEGLSWRHGAAAARKDWLLCLDDGDIPQEGWIRALERFIGLGARDRPMGRLRRSGGLLPKLRAMAPSWLGRTSVRAGDLVRRRVLLDDVRVASPVLLKACIERDPAFG
ncbi:glycosyltransferase family 2 protein [Microvirga pudoricolor]|uniref:hypothetical protein n=1 Tax=Microvirga pudoricolor TaxID=2778729 RepID=UPI0019528215|nr:hypothetical protein [Microvirga pudoricolor]MBM6594570.1 hypothetical protein [Microvirga pudoricolor]